MIIAVFMFIAGLLLLVKGADYFVDGGGGLAARYGVSASTIGVTVIAFGTSLPEFGVSINALLSGDSGIATGNILGSNIANIALVLALCALIKPSIIYESMKGKRWIGNEAYLMIAATLVFALFALSGTLGTISGIVFLSVFLVILTYIWKSGASDGENVESHGKKDYIFIIGGLLGVVIGSQLLLNGSLTIAEYLGIPSFIIGMSMVAVGTSLPELVTSLMAIIKGQGGISIGNLFGSNIFNLLFVLGIGALLKPVAIPDFSDVIIMCIFTFAGIILFVKNRAFTRIWAVVLLAGYFAYMGLLFA
ncbi:cation:H+ antiporter [Methanomicrobium sp. W14]|uniref:calcium/sodium antiporter n=1 Tax=Methanomicrobium sp. W14 TaxID=2817839 RepID=UPI001AE4099D|nr:calcium/sodium antiporter [Methanomicrobium sp. W14]MBP2133666.1 cation:H+ antiporter [Methanomicrobium sp. W14]